MVEKIWPPEDEEEEGLEAKARKLEMDISEDVLREINRTKYNILKVLDEHPKAKDSYEVLVTRYHEKEIQEQDIDKSLDQLSDEQRKENLTSPPSIARAFRKLQQKQQFTSESTQKKRNERADGFEESMGKA